METDKAALRDRAAAYFSQGKWEKALEDYRALSRREPKDLRNRLKIGEVLGKLGKKAEAIDVYRDVAGRYAQGGFLLQAIAVNKLILAIDPSQEYVQKELARLYAKKGLIVDESRLEKEARDIKARRREGLPRIALFSDLTEPEFLSVIQKMRPRRYPPGAAIVREGEEGDSLFIITEGEVDVYKKDMAGKQVWINALGEGEFFGEFGFFSESRRKATVKAKTEVEVQELTRADMEEIASSHPRVSKALVEFYKVRVLDSLLAICPLFRSLTPQQRDLLLDKFELMTVKEGDIIIREGEIGDALYIIKSGEVEVYRADEKEGRVALACLKEGDFFGEMALITGNPRTATVRAVRPTRLMRLSKKDFDEAAAEAPSLLRSARRYALERRIRTIATLLSRTIGPLIGALLKGFWNLVLKVLKMRRAKKVLVIEDDAEKRKTLETYLAGKGYEVTSAESGEQGVKEAAENRPDVVLLDPLLPGAGGLEVLKQLEEKGPPVVLVTPSEPHPAEEDEDVLTNVFLQGSVLDNLNTIAEEEEVELVPLEEAGRTGDFKDTSFAGLLHMLGKEHFTGTVDVEPGAVSKRIHFLEGSPVFVEFGSLAENLGDLLLRKGDISQEIYLKSVEEMARSGKKQGEVLIEMGALKPEGIRKALEDQVVEKLFNCFSLTAGTYRIKEGKEHLSQVFSTRVNTYQIILEGIKRGYSAERLQEELARVKDRLLLLSGDYSERRADFGTSLKESEAGRLLSVLSEKKTLDEIVARSPLELKRTMEILLAFLVTEMLTAVPSRGVIEPRQTSPEIQDVYDNWEKWKLL